jgi:hypothetical protein
MRLIIINSKAKQSSSDLKKINLGLKEGISSGIRFSMQNSNKFFLDFLNDHTRKPINKGSRNNNVKSSGCLIFIST